MPEPEDVVECGFRTLIDGWILIGLPALLMVAAVAVLIYSRRRPATSAAQDSSCIVPPHRAHPWRAGCAGADRLGTSALDDAHPGDSRVAHRPDLWVDHDRRKPCFVHWTLAVKAEGPAFRIRLVYVIVADQFRGGGLAVLLPRTYRPGSNGPSRWSQRSCRFFFLWSCCCRGSSGSSYSEHESTRRSRRRATGVSLSRLAKHGLDGRSFRCWRCCS